MPTVLVPFSTKVLCPKSACKMMVQLFYRLSHPLHQVSRVERLTVAGACGDGGLPLFKNQPHRGAYIQVHPQSIATVSDYCILVCG